MRAVWNNAVIAESDDIVTVEGNAYFPEAHVNRHMLTPSSHTSVCGWKGLANYYSVVVAGRTNENAAWYYADPKPQAEAVRGRVAFWKGVEIKP